MLPKSEYLASVIFSIFTSKMETKHLVLRVVLNFAKANIKKSVICKTKSLDSKLQAGLREEEAGDEGPGRNS